ncbi:MAG: proteobacterial dedicated sortase system response regulator [Pseudomonadota bacterium]
MQRHIALIEDDAILSSNYADYLEGVGFSVDRFFTKQAALQGMAQRLPDLVLLDVALNRELEAGYDICVSLRSQSPSLPIVFLTGHNTEVDRISALRVGADDHISKGESMRYLVTRIEALFRRLDVYRSVASSREASVLPTAAPVLLDEHLMLDGCTSSATWHREPLSLTLTQFWLLQELCRVPGQVRSPGELMSAARIVVEANTIAAHIKAIRAAFQRVEPTFDRIRTERGRGYRWVPASGN